MELFVSSCRADSSARLAKYPWLPTGRPHPPGQEIMEDFCQIHFMIFVPSCLDRDPLDSALLND